MSIDLEHALTTIRQAVHLGAEAGMRRWRKPFDIELKADQSVVTIADREAEQAIFKLLRHEYPEHAILGEESGAQDKDSRYRWIVDPIDGTLGFSRGGISWGPLIALEEDGVIIAGALGLPVLGDFYVAAKGLGCWNGKRRMQVSSCSTWSEATLSLGELHRLMGDEYGDAVRELCRKSKSARCYGDCAAVTLVLEGRAEAYIEAGVKVWDLGPMPILLSEAGGRFTDLDGGSDLAKGTALGTNGLLHDELLEKLRSSRAQSAEGRSAEFSGNRPAGHSKRPNPASPSCRG